MLGEGARTAEDADRYLRSYLNAARHLGTPAQILPAIATSLTRFSNPHYSH
jgi:cytochrome c-type biogenesis protein CcmH/NrfG